MGTGGSSGIGLSIAHECLELKQRDGKPLFSHMTLIARNRSKLEVAKKELHDQFKERNENKDCDIVIETISADVSDYKVISEAIEAKWKVSDQNDTPPPTILFNVAGTSIPCRFETSDPTIFSQLMNVNYLGSVNVTRILTPHMIRNGGGTIILTSSAAGQVGVYGYSAYSPTKFALRGLAEVLLMELAPFDIHVQLAFPPNTDTPGFQKENELKMEECRLMEDTAGLFQPQEIAKTMVKEALCNNTRFQVYFGLEGWMLSTLTSGMSSVHTFLDAVCQVFLMSLLRFISLFYLKSFRRIVEFCHVKRTKEQSSK